MSDILIVLITIAIMIYLVQIAYLSFLIITERIETKKQFWKMLIPFSFVKDFIDIYKEMKDE